MAGTELRSGLKSAPTGPEDALDFAPPFTFCAAGKRGFGTWGPITGPFCCGVVTVAVLDGGMLIGGKPGRGSGMPGAGIPIGTGICPGIGMCGM